MKKLMALIPTMLILVIAFMLLPTFTGKAVATISESVISNATGCYQVMTPPAIDVPVDCMSYTMSQMMALLVGIAPYIAGIGICIGIVYAAFKGMF